MKKISILVTSILVFSISIILINSCEVHNDKNDYLFKVLHKLEQINSATYNSKSEGWAPGDTAAYKISYNYMKEFNNLMDTTIGASFVCLNQNDTTQMRYSYDGNMKAIVYEDSKLIVIDSFNLRKLSHRPIKPPFFNYAKSILAYALETEDSIAVNIQDIGDSVYFILKLAGDKQLEFFGEPYLYENPFSFGEEISQYEIWIDKSTQLPYKIRREMSHDISVRTCSNVELNKINIEDFKASDYFQSDYSIEPYRMGSRTKKSHFEGKLADYWTLKDAYNKSFALQDLKSKVVLIQFTSVSCGPCRASIPFLKKLVTEYSKDDFDFIAIDAFAKNSNVLSSYQIRNDFNYTFLMSSKELNKKYQVQAVPVFFLLDENRVIRKVIQGYATSVDKQIRDAINQLI